MRPLIKPALLLSAAILALAAMSSCGLFGGGEGGNANPHWNQTYQPPWNHGGAGSGQGTGKCFRNPYQYNLRGWGVVRCYSDEERRAFQDQARTYLSILCNQADLNRIQGFGCLQSETQSRMHFRGKVFFQNAKLSLSHPAQSLTPLKKSFLEALIIPSPSGLYMPPVGFQIKGGSVRGHENIQLSFITKRQTMKLILRGRIDENGRFTGQMSFERSDGVSGRLGSSFAIQACDFFDCL